MRRLLVLFHDPYHLNVDEARAWVCQEVAGVLARDEVQRARLTRLDPASGASGGYSWLLEFGVAPGQNPQGAVREMVADLRLLGMSPLLAVADDRNAVDLEAR